MRLKTRLPFLCAHLAGTALVSDGYQQDQSEIPVKVIFPDPQNFPELPKSYQDFDKDFNFIAILSRKNELSFVSVSKIRKKKNEQFRIPPKTLGFTRREKGFKRFRRKI